MTDKDLQPIQCYRCGTTESDVWHGRVCKLLTVRKLHLSAHCEKCYRKTKYDYEWK